MRIYVLTDRQTDRQSVSQLQPAASIHDQQSRSCFSTLMKCNNFSSQQWDQIVLLIRKGGFGLTAMIPISTLSFLSSWAFSIKELPFRFPILQLLIDAMTNEVQLKVQLAKSYSKHYPQTRAFWSWQVIPPNSSTGSQKSSWRQKSIV